ncbi:hypothetical protein AYI70_g3829 [Smittium culicis]|uniref:SAM domain-containing protein n=1 Tax=Smittium culicis TaxID=133412 RepID=A0A1R1Y1N3_9FUNG|nr:hypothetical protein AYI70_g3829 [Smittium culicis]
MQEFEQDNVLCWSKETVAEWFERSGFAGYKNSLIDIQEIKTSMKKMMVNIPVAGKGGSEIINKGELSSPAETSKHEETVKNQLANKEKVFTSGH